MTSHDVTAPAIYHSRDKGQSKVVSRSNSRYFNPQREEYKGHNEVVHVTLVVREEHHRDAFLQGES